MALVSVIIPCHNPGPYLLDAISSVREQVYEPVEIVLVNDGSDTVEAAAVLSSASTQVDQYIVQPQKGPSAARNAGIRAASGSLFVPLDCDDVLEPAFISESLASLETRPDAAFVYPDYRVFGTRNYTERLEEYNLFRLLERNTLIYAALIRKQAWEAAQGYDESMRCGYEDWEFWLRLAAHEHFGVHLPRVLFRYRKHGRSHSDVAAEHHGENIREIRAAHPELYSKSAMIRIKTRWEPAICVAGCPPAVRPTIQDWEAIDTMHCAELLEASRASAFLIPAGREMDPHDAELGALAVWGGAERIRLADGSMAVSRGVLQRAEDIREIESQPVRRRSRRSLFRLHNSSGFLETVCRHLVNAELLSTEAWARHPLRSTGRLIPLRVKERVNRLAGRTVFDLTFYTRFQPLSLPLAADLVTPLRYFPGPASNRRRVAFVTPHLGPGGAESVLLEIAKALDRSRNEILLIATQSRDSRWLELWQEHVDHVYDLASILPDDRLAGGVYSTVRNWACNAVLVMNSLPGYSVIPQLKRKMPGIRTMDLVHAVGKEWDLVSCTAAVANDLDVRIVISEKGRQHLRRFGVPDRHICLIRNGIDLQHFRPAGLRANTATKRILFAGRLDPVKRPLLLVDIATALLEIRKTLDFRFVVAGDGPEEAALREKVERSGLQGVFEYCGQVPNLAPLLVDSDLLVIPSKNEGIPLVMLEALATSRPVIASHVGAIGEVLDQSVGVLIEPGAGEAKAFAEAIDCLLDEPHLRIEMGRNGRRKVEAEYDRAKAHSTYRELFGESGSAKSMVCSPE